MDSDTAHVDDAGRRHEPCHHLACSGDGSNGGAGYCHACQVMWPCRPAIEHRWATR